MPTAQALRVLSFGIVATRAVGNGVGGDAISAQRANYTFASPRNLTFVRTLFSGNDGWGYRDPTARVTASFRAIPQSQSQRTLHRRPIRRQQ